MISFIPELKIFYILFKYNIGTIDKITLIKEIKTYIETTCHIFVKFVQLFLTTQYVWSDKFTIEEITEINDILNNFNYDNTNKYRIGCGSVASVYIDKNNKNIVNKKLIPNIIKNIDESYYKFKTIKNISRMFGIKVVSDNNFEDYKNSIVKQTDLIQEVNNLNKMAFIFKHSNLPFTNFVRFPKIYKFNKESITMSYIKGVTLNEFIKKYPDLEFECCKLLFSSIKLMILNNFLHGDLHEGNYLFDIENKKVVIYFIDFGITNVIDDTNKQNIINYLENHNILNRCKMYYEMTNKTINFDMFMKIYIENMKSIEGSPGENIQVWKKYGVELNLNYINLIISIINLKIKYINKYKTKLVDVLKSVQ